MFSGIKLFKIQILYAIGYKFTIISEFIPFRVQKYKKNMMRQQLCEALKNISFEIYCKLQ